MNPHLELKMQHVTALTLHRQRVRRRVQRTAGTQSSHSHGFELAREPRSEHVVDAKVVLVLVCRRIDGVGRHSAAAATGAGQQGQRRTPGRPRNTH